MRSNCILFVLFDWFQFIRRSLHIPILYGDIKFYWGFWDFPQIFRNSGGGARARQASRNVIVLGKTRNFVRKRPAKVDCAGTLESDVLFAPLRLWVESAIQLLRGKRG